FRTGTDRTVAPEVTVATATALMEKLKTINAAAMVYGEDAAARLDGDPMEQYHESSKLYPSYVTRQLPGVFSIESNQNIAATMTRSSKQYRHLARVPLPP